MFALNKLRGLPSRPVQVFTSEQTARIAAFFAGRSTNYNVYETAYRKVVYGSMIWEAEGFGFIADSVRELVGDGHQLFGDLYLELGDDNTGFEDWHTDHNSLMPLEEPFDMVSIWISLGAQTPRTGGGLFISAPDEISIQLARISHLETYHPDVAALYASARPAVHGHLERTGALHHMRDGECLVFSNALYHRTEPVKLAGFVRRCLILRVVKTPLRVSLERLATLERKGTADVWVRRWRQLLARSQ
ncbi:MAG TPA: hypothetical protein VFQ53_25235 [Kofleriaceae bacterium]|nr:hypothetical protein [Kofleriaceae bacterium]